MSSLPRPRGALRAAAEGRLLSRPDAPGPREVPPLLEPQVEVYVPAVPHGGPRPLIVMLHGSGADARQGVALFRDEAARHGALLLAPRSRGRSWDMVAGGGYGPDVAALDAGLEWVFTRHEVDPARVAIGGFSDGASYALSLGITNGDLFRAVLAFSPGFMAPAAVRGTPRIYVSHGRRDRVLAIEATSRRLVPMLRRSGYDVRYDEFDGDHVAPKPLRAAAGSWWLAD